MSRGGTVARKGFCRSLEAAGIATVELLLRPERFMRALLRFRADSLPFLLIWILGVSGAIDGVESGLVLTEGLSRPLDYETLEWKSLWPRVLLRGLGLGPLLWLLWGWWYRVRLGFCGVTDVGKRSARLVWAYSRSVVAIPSLVWLIVLTLRYDSYAEARNSETLGFTLLALVFWSIFVGYRGAVGCFGARRVPALWWFLILPMALIAGVFLATFTMGLIGAW